MAVAGLALVRPHQTSAAAQQRLLPGLELCSPVCRVTKSLPGLRAAPSPSCCCRKPLHLGKWGVYGGGGDV